MLQSNFASLARTIGSLFIPVLQTVLPYINAVTIALQRMFAYLAKVLGIKLSDSVASMGGISVDTSNIADDMDAASDAIDNSNKNAKKLAKTLSVLSFDELNQLSSKSDTSDTGAGSTSSNKGANAHIPALDTALDKALANYQKAWDKAFKSMSNRANKMADAIVNAFKKKDWDGLGKIMASGINWGMQKIYDAINWNNVGPTITKFTGAFTTAFNSLIKNTKFDLIGRTIGAGVNTIVNTMNQLLEGIKWEEIGKKFAEGITGLASEVDWGNLGNLLGNSFMKGWRIFTGFVENLPYSDIGKDFADGLNGIFDKVDFTEIAHALATGLNGAFTTLATFAENFKWDDLVQNITNGISTFIQEFKWKENGQKLETFINNLLDSLVDIASNVNWEAFGHNVGVFLSQIDWVKHIGQLLDVLTEVIGGIWEGLGTTSAGKFVQAIAIFAVGSKLMPFVNNVSKFLTGSTVTSKLSTAIQGMLNPAITSVAETAVPLLGTSLGSLVATGGGIALAVTGAVLLTKKLAGLFETMQGGNGMTTQYGGYLHDYATQLTNVASLTNEQSEALWQLIETDEELGKSHDEMYSDMVEKLKEYGVSADQAKSALEQYGAQAGVSAEFVDGMTDKIAELGEGVSEAASKFDTSKISISELRDELYMLSLKSDEFGGSYRTAMEELDNANNVGTITTTKDALDAVYTSLKNAGVPLDELDQKLREDFPGATVATKTAVDKNIVGAQKTISSSVKKASDDTKQATGDMADTATSDFAEIQSKADEYLQGVNTSTTTNWGNSSDEVYKNVRQMKIDVSTGLGNMDKTVTSHFGSQYNIMTTKWQKAAERITGRGQILDSLETTLSRRIPSMSKYFDKFTANVVQSMGSLREAGQIAAQSFADGFKVISIPTPHLQISSWNTHRLYNGGWFQTPNFSVNWYKKGGLFDSASVIGVGEAGKEAVLPLENKKAMKSIADSIVSSSDGNMGLTKEEIMQAVAQGVSMAMMNNSGGSSNPQYIMNSISWNGREIAKVVTEAIKDENSRFNPSPAY